MSDALPVIDLAGLASGEDAAFDRIAAEIGAACRTVGFFYVVNHGVATALMGEAFQRSAEFFAAPLPGKEALAIERVGGNRGYSGLRREALDPRRGADLKEAFNIGLDLAADDREIIAGAPFRTLNVWPAPPQFRTTMLAYFDACGTLARAIHRAIARDLALPPDYFAGKLDRPMATLRPLHYPASEGEGEIGAGEHTDYGNITLLATDEVGGLEAHRRDGAWVAAPPMPGAFIVNIGDCLMRWTNDVYVSTPHRVVNRSGRERYSIAFFFDPNPEALVEAIPSCIAPGATARYAPILAADYLKARLDASKPAGM
jgi:isopenicillin N synthase-like dioxygenase